MLPPKKPVNIKTTKGIDLGLTHFLTSSDGDKIENPKNLNSSLIRLAKQQKRFSRLKKGSNQREKQRIKIAKLHQRITQKRNDFIHKQTFRLLNDNQVETIAMENLNVKGMIKNRKLSRHIADVSWGKFRTILDYKADWMGKNRIECDRFDPSSRLCTCGTVNKELTLADREWTCPSCKTHHLDRDVLAANNIKEMAIARYLSGKVLSVA